MDINELKKELILLIGICIDEESILGVDSFVEMDKGVIHYVGEGGEKFFKVSLKETTEDKYWNDYEP